ncbi:hypothetical protein BHE74_00011736 [Ensete ventricosum]|nr:hypothetical protein BHE74_00011736 [Ensete ventricosum]RZR78542.1 hypothetical protein BHM03_00003957 [Ensete ventricosum]
MHQKRALPSSLRNKITKIETIYRSSSGTAQTPNKLIRNGAKDTNCPGGGRWPGLSSSAFRTRAAVGEEAKARSSFDDVKRACKQMVRKCRTDVSPPDRAEEYTRRFIEVQEAYETLSDSRRGCFSLSPPGGALMRLVISR